MRKTLRIKIFFVLCGYSRKHRSYIFGSSGFRFAAYRGTERHGTAHHARVGIPCAVVVTLYHFRQSVDYAYKFGCVVKIQLGGGIGYITFDVVRHVILADGKDKHLVIGQQAILYGVGEIHPVELFPVKCLVIH